MTIKCSFHLKINAFKFQTSKKKKQIKELVSFVCNRKIPKFHGAQIPDSWLVAHKNEFLKNIC